MTATALSSMCLPALFVSHGSPMFAIDPGQTGPALADLGFALRKQYPALRGIVIMSPHWMAPTAQVMSHPQPATWHDFGGFPEALYRLQYPAPGSPALAAQVQQLLHNAGVATQANADRPLDHGAWVPLRHLFPQADVPVVQVALPYEADAAEVFAIGQALATLRSEGVLVVGSGSMTHNLRELVRQASDPQTYVLEFCRWIEDRIRAHDMDSLLHWREQAPHALRAHPTDEHFLTLYFALGAGGEQADVHYLSREVMYGVLAMDSFILNGHASTIERD